MSYDKDKYINYTFPLFDFGGGAAETYSFRLPPGMQGEIVSIGISVTEVFATDTTTGSVEVGTASNADAYAKLVIPNGTADNDFFDQTNDTDAIIANIPANQLIRVTLTNGTDAIAVTGQGIPSITVRCWK